ncbi:hypothetical protein VCSRO96_1347 [Vibrio cholerae]|uniref:helix-turn-helix domain-containing protein n=1 Tax=Vibrio cholerae TaxID=666 RepID=UPI00204B788D|nr:helix-turn-helix transcriptional regulator [Vibrio cholerae]MDV2393433.1 helix-turn-helix transcriptional regulator [Vibrio cholerae]BCK31595.1 hypothetical protein VCSRO96_1339 [Vibrio cholerae]BCK31603.1 hypothetical protein VCSRO96_1347 [Vibrio cholerae]
MPNQEIALRIKEIIKDYGGYEKMSEKIGVHTQTLLRIAGGKTEPKLKDVVSIAEATGVKLDYIVYGLTNEESQELSDLSKKVWQLTDKLPLITQTITDLRARIVELEKSK